VKANAAEVSALPPEPAHHGGLAGVHTGVWLLNLETQEESITPDGSSALSVEVLRSNASGSVLIGVIPDSGGGRGGGGRLAAYWVEAAPGWTTPIVSRFTEADEQPVDE